MRWTPPLPVPLPAVCEDLRCAVGVAFFHDHDDRFGFAGGDQIVENEAGASLDGPLAFVAAGAVLEVKNRVALLRFGIVFGRRGR